MTIARVKAPLDAAPASISPPDESWVVRRTWVLRLECQPGTDPRPLLTGVFGFPWRSTEMDAKCTMLDQSRAMGIGFSGKIDRHHRRIPAIECTCGIYGAADETIDAIALAPSGVPLVTGLVELSGHVIRSGAVLRAQHARIVGPLALDLGRKPLGLSIMQRVGIRTQPVRVRTARSALRVTWGVRHDDAEVTVWLANMRRTLAATYGVEVV